jgi:hypothetical protein
MNFGRTPSAQIPEQPALAEFPAQPWPERVQVQVKRFTSVWKMQKPFKDQEIQVDCDESAKQVWEMTTTPRMAILS